MYHHNRRFTEEALICELRQAPTMFRSAECTRMTKASNFLYRATSRFGVDPPRELVIDHAKDLESLLRLVEQQRCLLNTVDVIRFVERPVILFTLKVQNFIYFFTCIGELFVNGFLYNSHFIVFAQTFTPNVRNRGAYFKCADDRIGRFGWVRSVVAS